MEKFTNFLNKSSGSKCKLTGRLALLIFLLIVFGNVSFGQQNNSEGYGTFGPSVPTIFAIPEDIQDFNYVYSMGPSESVLVTFWGVNLEPLEGEISISSTQTNYEISFDNENFVNVLNFQYTGGSFSSTALYIRLKANLGVGNYSKEPVTIAGGNTEKKIICSGYVLAGILWDGGANTSNWNDADNWSTNSLPPESFAVILDNTFISGSYSVDIGPEDVAINKLIIRPASGSTITLTLTSANTGNPGLQVGDGSAETDDIIIYDGGTLINNSGAVSGSPIDFIPSGGGIIKIFNGGKYIHKTLGEHTKLVSNLSSAPETESGTFEFDVPMTSDYPLYFGGCTFGTLSLRNSTSFNYTTNGITSGPIINGVLQFDNSGSGSFSSNDEFTFYLKGNFINNGANLVFNNQTVSFIGYAQQSISGTGAVTFENLWMNNSQGILLLKSIGIEGALNLLSGALRTGNNSIIFGTNAVNPSESNTSYIVGTTVTSPRNVGTGALSFLGVYINPGPDNLTSVTISRITGSPVIYPPNEGINCKWDITSTPQPVNGRVVEYTWWSVFDNGKNFSSSNWGQVWKSEDNGSTWLTVDSLDVSTSDPRHIQVTDSSFSLWTVSSQNAPLPVNLQSFTFNQIQRNVKLNWITSMEENNSGFEVQRSVYKSQESEVWNKIGFVNGKGKSNEPVSYSYEDKNLESGKYKYRLKQIDNNGNYEYFELSGVVDVGVPAKFDLSQNYPNPFNPVTNINFDIPQSGLVSLKIYDILGREVSTLINEIKDAGYYTITFDASKLSSGVYFYRLTSGGFSSVKRLVVLK
jgi:hypothetical protein